MSVDTMHDSELSEERLREPETLSFADYETLCNQNNRSARKSGILSDEVYEAALEDSSTVFLELDGVRVPALVDVTYGPGLGYDERRTVSYAGTDRPISILAVPAGDLDDDAKDALVKAVSDAGTRSVFFADNEERDSAVLYEGIRRMEGTVEEVPLPNYRCRPRNRQAAFSLFVCDAVLPNKETEGGSPKSLSDVQRHFDATALTEIDDPDNAVLLKNGRDFTDTQLEDIWQLYEKKFEFLGENHPMSMEDTREDFLRMINDESVTVSIAYSEGKPVCFTFFTEKTENVGWLNEDYMDGLRDEDPKLTMLFFPGIVSDRAGGNRAEEVIALFTREAADVGMNARIVFENTNLSEMYVPRIVAAGIGSQPEYDVQPAKKVDQTVFRLARVN